MHLSRFTTSTDHPSCVIYHVKANYIVSSPSHGSVQSFTWWTEQKMWALNTRLNRHEITNKDLENLVVSKIEVVDHNGIILPSTPQ